MNRFNSLVDVQHFDAQNSVKKGKNMQFLKFPTIRNTLNIVNYFEKWTSEILN